jgi:hypothetical protein
MNETRFIGLLRMYFPRNWEFGTAWTKLGDFGGRGVFEPPKHPVGTPLGFKKDIFALMIEVVDITLDTWKVYLITWG